MNARLRAGTLLLLLLPLSACGGGAAAPAEAPAGASPQSLTEVRAGEALGTYVAGAFPEPTLGAAPEVAGSAEIVRGGALTLEVGLPEPAALLYVGVEGQTGYFVVPVPAAGAGRAAGAEAAQRKAAGHARPVRRARTEPRAAFASLTLALRFADDLAESIAVRTAYGTPTGGVSGPRSHGVRVNSQAQGSDRLQISLNWVHPVDLDLHVRTPSGSLIYYGNDSADGGTLDLDSNPACDIDGINNENVVWAEAPPCGVYEVIVDVWSACDLPGPFPYTVTLREGGRTTTHQGSLSGGSVSVEKRFVGHKVLGIHSNAAPSASFTAGHAWISVTRHDGTSSQVTTYGLWPDDHPNVSDNGSASDVRVNVELARGGYVAAYNRYFCLSPAQEEALRAYLAGDHDWTWFNTCADFASGAIEAAVGARVSASDGVVFGTPRSVSASIAGLEAQDPTGQLSPQALGAPASSLSSSVSSFDSSPQTR